MKKMIKTIFLYLILLLSYFNGNAKMFLSDTVHISGRVHNSQQKHLLTELRIAYVTAIDSSSKNIQSVIAKDGDFSLKLPVMNETLQIRFLLMSSEGKNLLGINNFVAFPGDKLFLDIEVEDHRASLNFKGNGAKRYNVKKELDKQWDSYHKERFSLLGKRPESLVNSTADLESKLSKEVSLLLKYKKIKHDFLSEYGLDELEQVIVEREFSDYNGWWDQIIENYYSQNKPYHSIIQEASNTCHDRFSYPQDFNQYVFPRSKYIVTLALGSPFHLASAQKKSKVNVIEYYNFLKKNYTGNIRDFLLFSGLELAGQSPFIESFTSRTVDSLVSDAITFVANPLVLQGFTRKKGILLKSLSSVVFNGLFEDLNNKKIDLHSLKGKVVFVDGWFTGCTGCVQFHSYFEKNVYPRYKDNKDFIVLSINADTNKDQWIKGLKSNLYSSDHYLNVNASGGINHPFFKFYGVKGFTWLMLVGADGRVVYQPQNTTAAKLIEQIDAALKTNNSPN